MRSCKNCVFCKKDLINNYIKEADLHKCDMDGDVILDVGKEGQDCSWFKEKRNVNKGAVQIFSRFFKRRNNAKSK